MEAVESQKLEACRDDGLPQDAVSIKIRSGTVSLCPADGCRIEIACVCQHVERAYTRRPAPTASPTPEGVEGDVAKVMAPVSMDDGGTDFYGWKGWLKYQEAARRLASHVQSQSSTMAGLREEVERLRGLIPEFEKDAAFLLGPERNAAQPYDRGYVDGLQHAIKQFRAALKPVARGE